MKKLLSIILIAIMAFALIFANIGTVAANTQTEGELVSNKTEKTFEVKDKETKKGFKEESKKKFNVKTKSAVKSAMLTDNITWDLTSGVLTISGIGEMQDFVYTSDLSQMPPWFENNRNEITKVVVEEGITRISAGAFYGCSNLITVELPSTLREIANYAFEATGLRTFNIPERLTSLSPVAFVNTQITAFSGGNVIYKVVNGVVYTNTGKTLYIYPIGKTDTSFTVPSGVTKIGDRAFQLVGNLKTLVISDTVTTTGDYPFYGSSIENITLGKGFKTLRAQTLSNCENLKTVKTLGLTSIPFAAFAFCPNLTTVNFNEGIKEIPVSAFYNCTSLQYITLPKSVKFVHSLAFPTSTKIICKDTKMRKYGKNGYRYLEDIKVKGKRKYSLAFDVLKLINAERSKNGLSNLKMDSSLMESAMVRAAESAVCFSHTRPDGSIAFDLSSKITRENIAIGQTTAAQVVKEWMASPGHKANILSSDTTTIGIGCFITNGIYNWAQEFGNGTNSSNCSKPTDTTKTQKITLAKDKFKEAVNQNGEAYISNNEVYSYSFKMKFDKSTIEKGKKTSTKITLVNAGWSYAKVVVENESFKWSSGYKGTATVKSSGKVTAKAKGIATITAKLEHTKLKKKITVGKNSKKPGKITLSSVTALSGKKMKVKWKKDSTVTGYQIRYSTSKSFTSDTTKKVSITKKSTTSKTISKLTKGKKYYVQIRAYRKVKVDGEKQKLYGSWSSKKNITAKK